MSSPCLDTWRGGAAIARQPDFLQNVVTRFDYEENGPLRLLSSAFTSSFSIVCSKLKKHNYIRSTKYTIIAWREEGLFSKKALLHPSQRNIAHHDLHLPSIPPSSSSSPPSRLQEEHPSDWLEYGRQWSEDLVLISTDNHAFVIYFLTSRAPWMWRRRSAQRASPGIVATTFSKA